MVAGQLELLMLANLARLQKDMTQGKAMVTSAVGSINKALGTIGVGVSFGALAAGINSAIDSMAKLDDQAEKTGASIEELSKFQQIARIGGHSAEVYEGALVRLSKSLHGVDEEGQGAGKALAALGLSQEKLRKMDTAEALKIVAVELNRYKDGAGKSALAMDLLGKSGAQALPFLKDLATEGGINARVTADQAAEAEKLQKAWGSLGNEWDKAKQQMAIDVIPWLQRVITELNAATKAAGGFASGFALAMSTHTGDPGRDIPKLEASLAKMKEDRDLLSKPGFTKDLNEFIWGDVRTLNAQIAATEAKLRLLRKVYAPGEPMDFVGDTGMPVPGDLGYKRDSSSNSAAEKARREAEKIAKLQEDAAEEFNKNVSDAFGFVPNMQRRLAEREYWENMFPPEITLNKTNEEIQAYHDNLLKGIDFTGEYAIVTGQLKAGFDGMGNALKTNTSLAEDLGLTFASAFEEAIVGGSKLRDVLKGMAQDILRLYVRRTVSEPGSKLLTELFKGIGSGGGGGAAAVDYTSGAGLESVISGFPKYATGTEFVPRDGMAYLHRGEAVIPADENRGGNVTIIQNLNFSANTPAASRDAVMAAAPMLISQAKAAVRDERDRKADRR